MRRSYPRSSALALLTVGLAACTSGATATGPSTSLASGTTGGSTKTSTSASRPRVVAPGRSRLGLERADGCDDLLTRLCTLATAHVTSWGLDAPGPRWYAMEGDVARPKAGAPATVAASTAARAAAPAEGSSGTNTQEVGVDEGDQVENDGRYVYSVLDGRLRVVDTTSGQQSSTALPENTGQHQLVLDGDRLVVVSGGWSAGARGAATGGIAMPVNSYGSTVVTVFDVSDALKPTVTQRRVLEGTAIAVGRPQG